MSDRKPQPGSIAARVTELEGAVKELLEQAHPQLASNERLDGHDEAIRQLGGEINLLARCVVGLALELVAALLVEFSPFLALLFAAGGALLWVV